MSRSTSESKPEARAGVAAHGRRALLASVGAVGHDRAVAILARALADAGFVVTRVEPGEDAGTAVRAAAEAGTIVGLSVRGPQGLATLPELLETAARSAPNARLLFVGGDFGADDGAIIAARHRVRVFSRDATTRDVVDWLQGAP